MAKAIEDLKGILGAERLLNDPDTLENYSKDESFAYSLKPRVAIKVQTADQIEDVIKWANRSQTPLVPVSSGRPHFRGDTVPRIPEAVIVDISEMNRIIRIDRRNRMALIEPGVTFSQIQPELAKSGLRLSSPLAPRANKSVLAALLEREPIIIPRYQWAALDPLRCLEMVWGDGQRMTTGEAGSLGSLQEEWDLKLAQANPQGPIQTDFYKIAAGSQGTMGIATWASVKCELLPKIHDLFFIPSRDLKELINVTYSILRIRFGDELFILNHWNLASLVESDPKRIKLLAERLPPWMVLIGIAGRERLAEERVKYQEKDLSEMAQKEGLQLLPAVGGVSGKEVLEVVINPSREPYWKLGYKGGCQEIFFLSTLERAPEFVEEMYRVAEEEGYAGSEIGMYIQPVHQGASCHIEFDLPYDRGNEREVRRMKGIYEKASEGMLKKGAYYSRPYGIWASMAFNRDAQSTQVIKKIKDIFDPNHIMNPGKLCF